ncbi:hypothetical protein DPMN_146253 [Dreissena polymorpha]|uniref:E3 ubiquitin-protein ligase UBR4 N-terminal domain-containing protein n=1 Tax=Dreissena polymorpha TaxID=45954 RepID=A0A9D4J1T8_DREPO|nr:hypothetical protein DPMN_146253 [Dreissena polymorpha]
MSHGTPYCFQETLMVLIKGLCTGQSYLPQSEEVTIKSRLKSAQCPPCVQQAEISKWEAVCVVLGPYSPTGL